MYQQSNYTGFYFFEGGSSGDAKGNERDPNLANNTSRTEETPITGDEISCTSRMTTRTNGMATG
ncbi:hypothetical protein WJU16_15810 [Chitinophaga pollutisoli]|uniref:Uncharacterized protein n=1 Tax=Chitinophaga pollutisoli TaxID=3133966 RepID=A0ABZ2YJ25_9BACT